MLPISIYVCREPAVWVSKLPARNNATIVINACNHRQCWNQNGATIVKAIFFFCHYYIAWEPNNAGEARGQSWDRSLKSRWIPGGSCGYTSGTKRKHFAALSSPRPCWRWLQLQPSCGSPQWYSYRRGHWKRNKQLIIYSLLQCKAEDGEGSLSIIDTFNSCACQVIYVSGALEQFSGIMMKMKLIYQT